MRLLVLSHGMSFGGAQISTLEFLKLVKGEFSIDVIVCTNADLGYISRIRELGLRLHLVPCKLIGNYPYIHLENIEDIIRKANVIWIPDQTYPTISRIKLIRDVPIVVHLRDYALICPLWRALYGLDKVCLSRCMPSKMVACRMRYINKYNRLGRYSASKGIINMLFSPGIGFIRYLNWPLKDYSIHKLIDGFISVSKATWDIHLRHIPEIKSRPHKVIYNPVSIPGDLLDKSLNIDVIDGDKYTILMGDKNPVKGPHILADAIKYLVKEGFNINAVFVRCKGSWVERYLRKIGIYGNATVMGNLSRRSFLELMMNSNVVAVPSIWPEPYGRVAAEANFLGTPAIASRIGGLPEIIEEGVTGYLVKPNDAVSFAKSLIKLFRTNISRTKIHKIITKKLNTKHIRRDFINFLYRI